jgi:hypothetical protein
MFRPIAATADGFRAIDMALHHKSSHLGIDPYEYAALGASVSRGAAESMEGMQLISGVRQAAVTLAKEELTRRLILEKPSPGKPCLLPVNWSADSAPAELGVHHARFSASTSEVKRAVVQINLSRYVCVGSRQGRATQLSEKIVGDALLALFGVAKLFVSLVGLSSSTRTRAHLLFIGWGTYPLPVS